jgi:hypothetical protein
VKYFVDRCLKGRSLHVVSKTADNHYLTLSANCTCFLWSHRVILSVSMVHVSFDLTKWYCQYQWYQLILAISLDEVKGKMFNWYWQYHLVRSKETCTFDTDNITWWDQRKHVPLIHIDFLQLLLLSSLLYILRRVWRYQRGNQISINRRTDNTIYLITPLVSSNSS